MLQLLLEAFLWCFSRLHLLFWRRVVATVCSSTTATELWDPQMLSADGFLSSPHLEQDLYLKEMFHRPILRLEIGEHAANMFSSSLFPQWLTWTWALYSSPFCKQKSLRCSLCSTATFGGCVVTAPQLSFCTCLFIYPPVYLCLKMSSASQHRFE